MSMHDIIKTIPKEANIQESKLNNDIPAEGVDCKGNQYKKRDLPKNSIDMSGKVFERLLVLFPVTVLNNKYKNTAVRWLCLCDCGNLIVINGTLIRNKGIKSCGCLRLERLKEEIFQDLTDMQFGLWTVEGLDKDYCEKNNIKNQKYYWKCVCSCGTRKSVCGDNLRSGGSTSCGCVSIKKRKQELINDLIGKHINNFTVIEIDEHYYDNKNPAVYKTAFKCKCDCGNIFSTVGELIKQNKVHRCPECNKKRVGELNFNDLTGQIFGRLHVEKFLRMKNHRAVFLCKCECGRYKEISGHDLVSGDTKSCGCLRSIGEDKIKTILEENNIIFEEQKIFPNCYFKHKENKSKFDFYINNSFLLEFDGLQHYKATSGWNNEEHYQSVKERDEYKNQWCRDNNIPLKRIPYWELNNITIENIMDDTFLLT